METHENIKRLRESLGLSQDALAQKVGYKDRSSIAKIEAGLVDLSQSKIAAFAAALNVSPAYLMGINDDSFSSMPSNIIPLPRTYEVPLIGEIACGEPILAVEDAEETVAVPEHVHADFALRCKGDSMINARIFDGDIVYIRRQNDVDDGEIAAVLIEEEATLKRVRKYPDHVSLEPANPMYQPFVYWGADADGVHIIGKAVAFTSVVR